MKAHGDIGVTQKTAWFMLQRIRRAFDAGAEPPFSGPAEGDETCWTAGGTGRSNAPWPGMCLGMAPTNGVESFRSLLQRAHQDIHRKIGPKHMRRHVADFAARHGMRGGDTSAQLGYVAAGKRGKWLAYRLRISDNGLASGGGPERGDVARIA